MAAEAAGWMLWRVRLGLLEASNQPFTGDRILPRLRPADRLLDFTNSDTCTFPHWATVRTLSAAQEAPNASRAVRLLVKKTRPKEPSPKTSVKP
jgi:hypothetical protein